MRFVLVLVIAAFPLSAQIRRDEPENPVARDPQAIEAGRKLFTGSCGGCHGAAGEGGRGPNLRDGKLIRRSSDAQMFQTIRKGVPGTDMPGTNVPDEPVWELVAFVRALGAPAAETIFPGDAARGERVYAANGCGNCHAISGRGGALGPDLSNAGGTRSYEYLRESIIKPGERISYGYQKVEAKLKDGRSLEGIARNYSNYDVQIASRDGKLYLLKTDELTDLKVSIATYMPLDYGKKITREELTDLLAYLSRQTLRPPGANR